MSEYTIEGDETMRWDVIASPPTRTAVVRGARSADEVSAYLPSNYPRLASGLMFAEEITS